MGTETWMHKSDDASWEETSRYELERVMPAHGPCRAQIKHVDIGSPADDAGLEEGMVLTEVEGIPLTDIIEWQWQADGFEVEVTLDTGEIAYLERELGQDWGITFSDSIFDGLITCRNACKFCFMSMLPKGMRPTLYERDDDYRLSFLQGNFVTLSNLSDEEVERIIEYDLQPLHVSLHATSDDVRRDLIGANAKHGKDVLERLLEAGIQVHTQLVVCPGINDGDELVKTLEWIAERPNILSCGLVPLGYTKFQMRFASSFSDDPVLAAQVIDLVERYQGGTDGSSRTRFHLADEFYLDANRPFPPATAYDGYPQFHDGIGMMRSFMDDWEARSCEFAKIAAACAGKQPATVVVGEAFARVLIPLIEVSPLAPHLRVLPVVNSYFGGNVDVTCLLVGEDIVAALLAEKPAGKVILPRENFSPSLAALDDVTVDEIAERTGCELELCTYCADELLDALA